MPTFTKHAIVLCLAAMAALPSCANCSASDKPAGGASDANNYEVTIIRRRPPAAKPRFVEVRNGFDVLQGLEFGQQGHRLLLLGRDGQIRMVYAQRDAIQPLSKPFEPSSHRELETELKKEFGSKFKTLRTAHYIVCHNTSDSFARETADLVEELYRAFTAYFASRGMGLSRPQFPMIVLIFSDEADFRRYVARSPGAPDLKKIAGYYSVETNRIAFFNAATSAGSYGDARWHNLSTVIHEATHQIAFNSGCHRRFADTPLWFVEGLAMYFEAPELEGSNITWGEIGRINAPRLDRFASFRKKGRPADSLKTIVTSDERFRSDNTAADAYAESWALTYYLANQRPAQFYKFIKSMIGKPALEQDSPEKRLEEFQAVFGRDLRLFDAAFLRYVDALPKK